MFSPSPISLICAILLCLPLAIVFTITTPLTTTGGATPFTATNGGAATHKSNSTRLNCTPKPTLQFNNKTVSTLHQLQGNDESVFSRAAEVNSTASNLGPRKVAFMFLTTSPLPFAPLWELYFNNTPKRLYNIYIHADPTSNYDTPVPFTGVFANRVVPSEPTRRYSPTLASAARRLLAHALLHDPRNYMFALLSPSCIPLHSFKFTYRVLIKSKKSFVEILKNERGAADRWAARGANAMLPEVTLDNFRIGSQFFIMTRKHARVVVSDKRVWPKFKLPCLVRYTCYPEEQYFATLLNMADSRGCVPATLTHVDWRGRHDGHPRTYGGKEVRPDLILALRKDRPRYGDEEINGSDSSVRKRSHPFLFARKFSVDSVQPLLDIANDVVLRD